MRINQFFSRRGICSKREADRWIAAGRIKVDGAPAQVGMKLQGDEKILIDNKPLINAPVEPWFVLYYKPRGVVTTKAEVQGNLTQALLDCGLDLPPHWFPVGRLDKDSEGLLLLTNQGAFAEDLLKRAESSAPKRYLVTVDKTVELQQVEQLSSGIELPSRNTPQKTLPCKVSRLADNLLQFDLQQGLHRQIRRMCAVVGLRVERLMRIEFAGLTVDGLKAEQWRYLHDSEIHALQKLIAGENSDESKTPNDVT